MKNSAKFPGELLLRLGSVRHSCKGCLQGEIEVWIVKTGGTRPKLLFHHQNGVGNNRCQKFNHSGYETVVLIVFISFGVLFNFEETNGRKRRKPKLRGVGEGRAGWPSNYSLELSWSYCTYSTCGAVQCSKLFPTPSSLFSASCFLPPILSYWRHSSYPIPGGSTSKAFQCTEYCAADGSIALSQLKDGIELTMAETSSCPPSTSLISPKIMLSRIQRKLWRLLTCTQPHRPSSS